ncbi:hypothetical protein ABIE28_003535 [Devosia sp. 2618]
MSDLYQSGGAYLPNDYSAHFILSKPSKIILKAAVRCRESSSTLRLYLGSCVAGYNPPRGIIGVNNRLPNVPWPVIYFIAKDEPRVSR